MQYTEPYKKASTAWHCPRLVATLSLITAIGLAGNHYAAWGASQPGGRWAVCGADGFPQPFAGKTPSDPQARAELPARLDADFAEYDQTTVTLRGGALVERGNQRVIADELTFDRETNVLTGQGSIRFDQDDVTIFGDQAQLDLDTDEGQVSAATYYMHSGHIRGAADRAYTVGDGTATFSGVTFTTCATQSKAWEIRAREIDLDTNAGRGTARHATLRIRNLPVFYSPYLTFPLDDRRKSGFLVPRWGNTETNGADITLPFYWNIAPNYDLTLFPRYMRKRGLMLGGEFRYLGETYDGSLFGSYLNDDDVFGDDRWAYSIRHNYAPTPRWTANIDYNKVSDDEYLQDFGNSIRFSSIAQLNQRGEVAYRGNGWRARGRIVKFQNVDPAISVAREPYERVPDFTFKGDWARQKFGLSYGLLADATWFEHPVNDLSEDNPERTPQPVKVNGTRLFMRPSVSYPFLRTWGFALPKLSLDFASYSLEDNRRVRTIRRENRPNRIRVTPLSNSITRTTPMFSFDTGLFFDRPIELGGNQLTQTLEPRLFYLYVPLEEDQNEIPRYDTDNVSQNYDFLFRESRFTGPDRLGDANQLTTAISTRILRDGRELFSASIGQIQYFRDREVTLSGIPDTRSASDVIAESSLRLRRRWSVRAGINYDTFANEVVKGRADLRYNPKAGRVLNVGYRFTRDDLEQTDVSGTWPLSHRWRLMGRWNQSIRDSLLLELLMGLEYQDCCWAVRVAGRRYRNGTEDPDIKNAIFFEVELKGLAGLGTNLRSLFSERIPGYVTEY